jgi:hypothetical protein
MIPVQKIPQFRLTEGNRDGESWKNPFNESSSANEIGTEINLKLCEGGIKKSCISFSLTPTSQTSTPIFPFQRKKNSRAWSVRVQLLTVFPISSKIPRNVATRTGHHTLEVGGGIWR